MANDIENNEIDPITENNILIVKARFKSTTSNLYGLLLVIFNAHDKTIDNCNIVVSSFSDIYDLEPHTPWDRYEERIVNQIWKGNYNKNMTSSMIDQFRRLTDEPRQLELLYDSAFNYDYGSLDITLFDLVNRIVHDKHMVMETGIQEITIDEFHTARNSRDKEPKEDAAPAGGDNLEDGAIILPIKGIVAPVKGKPIYDIKIGDRIMVKIQPVSDRANYFIDTMKLRMDNEVLPTPAEVVDLKAGTGKNDPIEIITQLGPGLFGRLIEEELQVKLRMYNPTVDKTVKPEGSSRPAPEIKPIDSPEEKQDTSRSMLIIFVLFMIILGIFITLVLISW